MERRITDDLDKLWEILPQHIQDALDTVGRTEDLLEIVLDLGRVPTARFIDGETPLHDSEVTREDIDLVVENLGQFDADNRAGMERSLHRISAIRNRQNTIIGLTCRVGRAVYGTIDIIEDLITAGKSVLLLGPPGVGKTTLLREAARVLAESTRVVIVDTSNEIGGDGDVPHPAVGRARRMQVSVPTRQHEVMIEAVENHNPQVIVIDEIGRELEAMAARTIAERGVQLVGTAHGNALDNLLLNPTLSDLVGGIESVTLSDDEARRRGTQKTVLERRSPPTFDVLVEIQTRDRLIVLENVADAVDGILRGSPMDVEVRERDDHGDIHITMTQPEYDMMNERQMGRSSGRLNLRGGGSRERGEKSNGSNGGGPANSANLPLQMSDDLQSLKVYAYGVARNRLHQAAKRLHVPLTISDDFGKADAVVTVKSYYRRRPRLVVDAERRGMPIYVLRANTVSQMENFLTDLFQLNTQKDDSFAQAMRETEAGIMQVQAGANSVDLSPQTPYIRKQQHQLIRKAHLESESQGDEPRRFVRIIHP